MFDGILSILGKKKHAHRKDSAGGPSRKELYGKFATELLGIKSTARDSNVQKKASEFYAVVKRAFKEALSLDYEPTFQEIQKEIETKRHFQGSIRTEIAKFLEELAEMEYGYEKFQELLKKKRQENEKALKACLTDLENDGEQVKDTVKKKIDRIAIDSVPKTDREFLIQTVDRFESFLSRIF